MSRSVAEHAERLGEVVQLSAEIISTGLRRAPLAVERHNLIQQGKRLRVAPPRERATHFFVRVPYPPPIENFLVTSGR